MKRFKKIVDWGSWIVLIGITIYVVISSLSAPSPAQAPESQVVLLNGTSRNLGEASEKIVIIFWATWCPPCKVELARVNRLVENNPSWAKKIVAISIGEDAKTVKAAVTERGYKFQVALDEAGVSAQKFEIEATPTILFKEAGNRVSWRSSGLSPSLEFRMNEFLK